MDWSTAAETERALSNWRTGGVLGRGGKRERDGRAASFKDLKVEEVKQW